MKYPSDLTDAQWEVIKPFFKYGNYGNRSKHEKRDLVNAVFYLTKTGCQWRFLPKDFPPHFTVHSFYRRARLKGIWDKITDKLVELSRVNAGRDPNPSYAIIDSQSIKTTGPSKQRGIDGGKKNKRT